MRQGKGMWEHEQCFLGVSHLSQNQRCDHQQCHAVGLQTDNHQWQAKIGSCNSWQQRCWQTFEHPPGLPAQQRGAPPARQLAAQQPPAAAGPASAQRLLSQRRAAHPTPSSPALAAPHSEWLTPRYACMCIPTQTLHNDWPHHPSLAPHVQSIALSQGEDIRTQER